MLSNEMKSLFGYSAKWYLNSDSQCFRLPTRTVPSIKYRATQSSASQGQLSGLIITSYIVGQMT